MPPGDLEVHDVAGADPQRLRQIIERDHTQLYARGFMKRTPLHIAVSADNFESVRVLMSAGADVNAFDMQGEPPIFSGKSRALMETLKAAGARLDIYSEQGLYGFQNCAAYVRSIEAMQFWLEQNIEINHIPDFAWPALNGFCAMAEWLKEDEFQRELPMLLLLIEHGADINLQDKDGQTALMDSCWHQFIPLTKFLLNSGAVLTTRDRSGWTALHYAVERGNRELVGLLLEHGADPNQQDKHGYSAIDVAKKRNSCLDILERLSLSKPEESVPDADQVLARLRSIEDFAGEFFYGCTDEEIDNLERQFKVVLPAAYRYFLKCMGKGVGDFMVNDHIEFQYDYLFGQAQSEDYNDSCDLTRYSFVFASRLGDQHYFFEADGLSNDPPVFRFDDRNSQRLQVARSIWEFIETFVINEEIYRGI